MRVCLHLVEKTKCKHHDWVVFFMRAYAEGKVNRIIFSFSFNSSVVIFIFVSFCIKNNNCLYLIFIGDAFEFRAV